jgi:hypothetical protein
MVIQNKLFGTLNVQSSPPNFIGQWEVGEKLTCK